MISSAQVRGARGLLGWSQSRLAQAAALSLATVRRYETGNGSKLSLSAVRSIHAAIEAAGVIFVAENGEGPGVRLRKERQTSAPSEAQMQANAADVRSQAADAADEAMSGLEGTAAEKRARRSELTDEPAVISRARKQGNPRKPT